MKLEFKEVTVTGLVDAIVRQAVVGDTTILVVKDHTGEMSIAGFKTPVQDGRLEIDVVEPPKGLAPVPAPLPLKGKALAKPAKPAPIDRLPNPVKFVDDMTKKEIVAELAELSRAGIGRPPQKRAKVIDLRSELRARRRDASK